ncbi:transposase [Streptosporangium sp. NPDC023825]|uniref:transposase n=1 Tax=Streptosporangium sp. NPDC023825 TaxID=3154909 RepID=UPI00342E6751
MTQRIVDVLRRRARKEAGHKAEPSAAVMDSQSVKGADTVGADSRGYDANKKINGRKRFVVTDTLGLLLAVMVRPAGVQDRAGATTMRLGLYLTGGCRVVFADQGFAGRLVIWARQMLNIVVHIVRQARRSARLSGASSAVGGAGAGLADGLSAAGP